MLCVENWRAKKRKGNTIRILILKKSVESSVAAPRATLNTHALPPSSATPLPAPAPPTATPQFLPATDFSTEPESCLAWRALPNNDPCSRDKSATTLTRNQFFAWLPHSLVSLHHHLSCCLKPPQKCPLTSHFPTLDQGNTTGRHPSKGACNRKGRYKFVWKWWIETGDWLFTADFPSLFHSFSLYPCLVTTHSLIHSHQ